jgi:hypothetical protein
VSANDAKRILALQRAGLNREAVAAIFDLELDELHAITTDPENNHLPAGGGGSEAPAFVTHDYASDGDANGIFYALGLEAGGGSFVNPAPADGSGPVLSSENAVLGSDAKAENLTDRTVGTLFHSGGNGNNWALWDFGAARSVSLRDYTVKSRYNSGLTWPTAWQLQASNDNATWDVLDDVTAPGWTAVDQWRHFVVDSPDLGPYRYVRIIDYADAYLVMGEVELYGDLYPGP